MMSLKKSKNSTMSMSLKIEELMTSMSAGAQRL